MKETIKDDVTSILARISLVRLSSSSAFSISTISSLSPGAMSEKGMIVGNTGIGESTEESGEKQTNAKRILLSLEEVLDTLRLVIVTGLGRF